MKRGRKIIMYPGRPTCKMKGCKGLCQFVNYSKDGSRNWRKYCYQCHLVRMDERNRVLLKIDLRTIPKCMVHGCLKSVKILGLSHNQEYLKLSKCCKEHTGKTLISVFKKTYCENIDGRLGFECTTTILLPRQLEVDHINGDPTYEPLDGSNFQTLCGCCHVYKSELYGDYYSPGRKTLSGKLEGTLQLKIAA